MVTLSVVQDLLNVVFLQLACDFDSFGDAFDSAVLISGPSVGPRGLETVQTLWENKTS